MNLYIVSIILQRNRVFPLFYRGLVASSSNNLNSHYFRGFFGMLALVNYTVSAFRSHLKIPVFYIYITMSLHRSYY